MKLILSSEDSNDLYNALCSIEIPPHLRSAPDYLRLWRVFFMVKDCLRDGVELVVPKIEGAK